MSGLFRDEVLQERRTQFLGTIRIGRNPSFTRVTAVALLLASALVGYGAWGEITRKTRLAGVLAPVQGPPDVATPQAGTRAESRAAPAPPGRLAAHLYAPSRTLAFVQAGQDVRLRYAVYPYQTYGLAKGTVESVSRTPLHARDLPSTHGQALVGAKRGDEPMYRITVALERQTIGTQGQTRPLEAGMMVEADVAQERRRIWEWLLAPVRAAPDPAKSLPGPAR